MKTQLLRSGVMVGLKSEVYGGVTHQCLEKEDVKTGSTLTRHRESLTTVVDVEEHDRAVKVRGAALYLIRKLCAVTPFSLLCPDESIEALDAGVLAAKEMVQEFNSSAVHTQISLYVIKGVLLSSDVQNAAAIAAEMRSLISEMEDAIGKMDPKKIRDAIAKADQVSQMFQQEQQEKVASAIVLARKTARDITRKINGKAAVALGVASDYRETLAALASTKDSFLDFEEPTLLSAEEEAPAVQMKDLDIFALEEESSEAEGNRAELIAAKGERALDLDI